MSSLPFYVYYRKEPSFRSDKDLKATEVIDGEKFALVAIMRPIANDGYNPLDSVYVQMQAEYMAEELREQCKASKAGHTSMSVGDCLKGMGNGLVFECTNDGWRELP